MTWAKPHNAAPQKPGKKGGFGHKIDIQNVTITMHDPPFPPTSKPMMGLSVQELDVIRAQMRDEFEAHIRAGSKQ